MGSVDVFYALARHQGSPRHSGHSLELDQVELQSAYQTSGRCGEHGRPVALVCDFKSGTGNGKGYPRVWDSVGLDGAHKESLCDTGPSSSAPSLSVGLDYDQ